MKLKRLLTSLLTCLFLFGNITALATSVNFKIDKSNLEFITKEELLDIIDMTPESYRYNFEGDVLPAADILNINLTNYIIAKDKFNDIIYIGEREVFMTDEQLEMERIFYILEIILLILSVIIFVHSVKNQINIEKEKKSDAIVYSVVISVVIFIIGSGLFYLFLSPYWRL